VKQAARELPHVVRKDGSPGWGGIMRPGACFVAYVTTAESTNQSGLPRPNSNPSSPDSSIYAQKVTGICHPVLEGRGIEPLTIPTPEFSRGTHRPRGHNPRGDEFVLRSCTKLVTAFTPRFSFRAGVTLPVHQPTLNYAN
jgi:hypothetical protein